LALELEELRKLRTEKLRNWCPEEKVQIPDENVRFRREMSFSGGSPVKPGAKETF